MDNKKNETTNIETNANVDILIVEDSETQADHIAHLLSSAGYRVRTAENGRLGLVEARARKPTLIVSDISMPEMDGFAMCRELKADAGLQDVPVILLTALTSLHDVIKGLDCGADNFIRKPFEGHYLLGRIRFILANRALRSNERVQLGMKINLGGQTHFVTAERQQIFDLLISTYEEAIQMTEELRTQQNQIARSYQSLEGLYKIAAALNPAITAEDVAKKALELAFELPGVDGGCILLRDDNNDLRILGAQEFGGTVDAEVTCRDCICHHKLNAGELRRPELIEDCAILNKSPASAGRGHVSVPLALGDRILGVMNLLIADEAAVMEEDMQVLDTVGNQIAIALERANLYSNMETLVKERTEALEAERNLLSAVVNTTGALVILLDPSGRVVAFNPACERSLGWKFEEVRNRFYWELFFAPERAKVLKAVFADLKPRDDKLNYQTREELVARDGSVRSIIWSTSFLKRADQSVEYLLGTGLDVTELRVAEEKVQYLSNFDSFTGLPNRILFRDRIKLLQEKVLANNNLLGILAIHFPGLPLIREGLGTKAEQALLLQIASRLRDWGSGDNNVARVSDSTFSVVAIRREPRELSAVAWQILSLLDQPFFFEQQDFHLESAIGITIFPNDSDDIDVLSQCAEVATRRALANKTQRYEFYTPELNRGAQERFKLESSLRRAMDRDELLLYYQPQVDLKTGRIVGLEALLRWQHPELGFIPPGRFIALAEETGLILPIGDWVIRKACEQNRAWQDSGLPKIPVAVNLSANQFSRMLPGKVQEILVQTGLEPGFLELELTESVSMDDPETTIQILRTLEDMGVGLAIDDFGTGYSNLNYLKRFPVNKLKLDQTFVRDLISDPDDLAISRAVIAMAHSLRLRVIAEGVETEGQLRVLMQNGCDEMQGYLFSKPVDAQSCTMLLRQGRALNMENLVPRPYKRTLLFLDDDVNMTAAIRRVLRNKGYNVFTANCAADAFELLATNKVGVVLCDQRMPDISGIEFLSRVKHMYPAAVRIVLSGYTDLQTVTDAVNHGAIFKFLTKPWEDEELLAALNDAFLESEKK